MNWHLKYLIRHSMLALPAGAKAYRWLTTVLLGTNAGMAYKWFRVLPAHVRVLQQVFGADARAQRLWCFDSGATMAAGLAMALVSDEAGLLTDRHARLHSRYNAVSRRVLLEKGRELTGISAVSEERIATIHRATASLPAHRALAAIDMHYLGAQPPLEETGWHGSIGCIFSAGTLEHYTPATLETELAIMRFMLKPGGVMSHVVDHRDHRWHADKRLSPLAHLCEDEDTYQRSHANPLDYHNRWLRSNYIELFSRNGFTVQCVDRVNYTGDLPALHRKQLSATFRDASEDDLHHLVTHFIAVRA